MFLATCNYLVCCFLKYAEAVDKYRTVLRSVEEHKSEIRTDELQQLHTLHNLHEILLTKPAGVPPTLRDSVLEEQVRIYIRNVLFVYLMKHSFIGTCLHNPHIFSLVLFSMKKSLPSKPDIKHFRLRSIT